MKINLLYNLNLFDEMLSYLGECLRASGHEVSHIKEFISDDSDLTLSTGFLNIQDSLLRADLSSYRGKLIHWLVEYFPVDQDKTYLNEYRLKQFLPLKDKFHHIFVRDPRQISEMERLTGRKASGVLFCCPNPHLHKKINVEKKYDVMIYGNPSARRTRMIELLQDWKLNIVNPKEIWGEEKIKLINESKIILNIHYDRRGLFETYRVTECLGSGGFLLTENFEWYPESLKSGRDFVSCSYEEMPSTISYYLRYPDERRRIQDSGFRNIWKNFHWETETKKIFSLINKKNAPPWDNREIFFIVGSQRSGTTLLELMLDSHPDTAVFGEPRVYEKIENRNPQPLDKVVGCKIPMWTHRYDFFKEKFPAAKFLFMHRPIKAIAASMISLKGWTKTELDREIRTTIPAIDHGNIILRRYEETDNPIIKSILCAYSKQLLFKKYTSLQIMRVDYEELVSNPRAVIGKVLSFLRLKWDDRVLLHHQLHKGVYMGQTNSQRPVDASSIDKWKKVFTSEESDLIDRYLKELDQELKGNKVCPVCGSTSFRIYQKCPAYSICTVCDFHTQGQLLEKVYEGPRENDGAGPGAGHFMSDEDKKINENLACSLFQMFKPKRVLDVGCKYPWFLSTISQFCNSNVFKISGEKVEGQPEVLGIDPIEGVERYGKELGIPVLQADFETLDISNFQGKYDLITLIHVVEHFHNVVGTVGKILSCLAPHGNLFIRTPTPDVPGIERDFTDHHLKIHPHLFTSKSLKYLMESFGYEVYRQDQMNGYGQTDFYIRKKKDPTLSVCMIVRDEERNITDCLESIKDVADEIIIVDTGSKDKTKEVVKKYTDKIYDFIWVDDFSAARNFSLEKATGDYILWMDADDILKNPGRVRPLLLEGFDAYNFRILYGDEEFFHARLFRNYRGVRFEGVVHEYPTVGGLRFKNRVDVEVIHKTQKHSSENRSDRNRRILEKELEKNPTNARAIFYLANSLKELSKLDEAITEYRGYLGLSGWKDERWMAQKYIGQILIWQKKYEEAIVELKKALEIDDRWAETYYYIGEAYFYLKGYSQCIEWMEKSIGRPLPESPLWKEKNIYNEAPYRYISDSYACLENYDKALFYSRIVYEKCPSDELKQKIAIFETLANNPDRKIIECYRQGALGDCLMTTAALAGLKKKYLGCFLRYVTHPMSRQILEGNQYIDELTSVGRGDPFLKIYFCYPDKDSTLKNEGYPNKPLTRHLIKIFNECAGLDDSYSIQTECTLGEDDERYGKFLVQEYGQYATIHVQAGWSFYKEWYDDRWEEVVENLFKKGIITLQIGHLKDRILKNTVDLRGKTIKQAIAAIKYAKIHMGVDSFSNHASFAVKTPAVILFGSTSPAGSGYDQNINLFKGLECQPCYKEYEWSKESRGPCPFDKKCMDSISVDEVLKAVFSIV